MKVRGITPAESAWIEGAGPDSSWERESLPEGRCLRYRTIGPVEGEGVARFEFDLSLAAREKGSLILDVSGIDYLDDAATEVLVRLDDRLRRRKDVLVICGVHPLCLEIFQLSGIDCSLTLAHDLMHARVLLAKQAQGRERWH